VEHAPPDLFHRDRWWRANWLADTYYAIWRALVPWVGEHVLRLNEPVVSALNGSGDRTYDYVLLLCTATLAIIGAAVWSLLDRRSRQYTVLHDRLRIYVRYALGLILISYGLVKVFKLQFPFPGPMRLIQPYGESSPMGLLWTFMGYSTPYNFFTGAAEVLGGVLLFWRRTTTLGALVTFAVMTNIVILNFCYDVPVKLFSTHLLLLAGFLLLPDLRRLIDVLLLNRATSAAPPRIPFRWRWLERARPYLKVIGLLIILAPMVYRTHQRWLEHGDHAPRHALYGLYEVETFVRDGVEHPPLVTDPVRWQYLAIGVSATWVRGRTSAGEETLYRSEEDAAARTLTLTPVDEDGPPVVLHYTHVAPNLELRGTLDDKPVAVTLRLRDTSNFLLVSRGFRWINETPFNR
jgi:uncharacterized membrane protein YphA (DoxX/SURF4 family)